MNPLPDLSGEQPPIPRCRVENGYADCPLKHGGGLNDCHKTGGCLTLPNPSMEE